MQQLLRSAGLCFDWQHLARHLPDNRHALAFLNFARILEPIAQNWDWPDAAIFNAVPRRWSNDFTLTGDLSRQYVLLVGRVRAALRAAEGRLTKAHELLIPQEVVDDARHWSKPGYAVVTPLRVFVELQYTLAQKM